MRTLCTRACCGLSRAYSCVLAAFSPIMAARALPATRLLEGLELVSFSQLCSPGSYVADLESPWFTLDLLHALSTSCCLPADYC